MLRRLKQPFAIAALSLCVAGAVSAQDLSPDVFATVDDRVISAEQFRAAVADGARRKFFHGQAPAYELAKFQREIGERLVEHVLLLREAEKRGIDADPDWVKQRLDAFERRASQHPTWAERREALLTEAESTLREDSRVQILRAAVEETVGPPSEEQVRDYYLANPEKFTEPERFRVSTILLAVDPSASTDVWNAAAEEAAAIVAKLRAGADFAEIARLRSGDASAKEGGDMGYLHRGMLGAAAQAAIDAAELGSITDPVRLLEGVAVFRVDERPERRLLPLAEVAERARDLWIRERRKAVWEELRSHLRQQAKIQINEQHYLPMPG